MDGANEGFKIFNVLHYIVLYGMKKAAKILVQNVRCMEVEQLALYK